MRVLGSKKATITTYAMIIAPILGFVMSYMVAHGWITESLAQFVIGSFTGITGIGVGTYNIGQAKVDSAEKSRNVPETSIVNVDNAPMPYVEDDFELPEN